MDLPKRRTLTAARLAANRRNALKSTGPKTAAGKRRVSLNTLRAGLCSPELERELRARGEEPRDFRRMHRDLIALFRPGNQGEKDGVEAMALAWWKKARRIRGWVGAGEPKCDDLDNLLEALIHLLVLTQRADHRWWKARLSAVLGPGLSSPKEVRLRIERRLLAFGGRPGRRSYGRPPVPGTTEQALSPTEAALSRIMAQLLSSLGASSPSGPSGPSGPGTGDQDDVGQLMAEVMAAVVGEERN